jgi:toxin HigB-1
MIQSFRNQSLQRFWQASRPLPYKTLTAETILDVLYSIHSASSAYDAAFIGCRFDEWEEQGLKRYGMMISDHWLLSYGWIDGKAVEVDLERLD